LDFARHTYAVYALGQMVQQGLDIYCALPILSTYLGHRTIESTFRIFWEIKKAAPFVKEHGCDF